MQRRLVHWSAVFTALAFCSAVPLAGTAEQIAFQQAAQGKAKFASPEITKTTPGHAVDIEVDIAGAKQLFLVVTDAGDGYACDWADWAEPRLVGPNLSEIGSKLSREAMYVSILDPSAGISHNYETYTASLDDGNVVTGILVSGTEDEITLKKK